METQKILNLLNASDKYNTEYSEGNEKDSSIKFETKVIKSNLCDYSETYVLLTGDITATGADANAKVAFNNCFTSCVTQ